MNRPLFQIAVGALFVAGVLNGSFAHAQEARVAGSNTLPDGEGRDIVAVACSQCHGLNAFTWLRQGPQAWRHQVYDMILRGTQISPVGDGYGGVLSRDQFRAGRERAAIRAPLPCRMGQERRSSKAAAGSAMAWIAPSARSAQSANGRVLSPEWSSWVRHLRRTRRRRPPSISAPISARARRPPPQNDGRLAAVATCALRQRHHSAPKLVLPSVLSSHARANTSLPSVPTPKAASVAGCVRC